MSDITIMVPFDVVSALRLPPDTIQEPCGYFEKKNQDAQYDTFADGGIYAQP